MIGVKFKPKIFYFGREVIRSNWNTMNKGPLTKSGNIVRRIARQSIRRRKRFISRGGRLIPNASPPGTPPFSHVAGRTPPFKMIYSLPIHLGTGVIVGMVGFNPSDPVPGLHEHGLPATRRIARYKRRRFDKQGRRIIYRRPPKLDVIRAHYPKRPFMGPALDKAKSQLPTLWLNSLHKASPGFTSTID